MAKQHVQIAYERRATPDAGKLALPQGVILSRVSVADKNSTGIYFAAALALLANAYGTPFIAKMTGSEPLLYPSFALQRLQR
ncbi:hypothetical protein Ct61P_06401 [Colletotrichum tofieldiae]|nr:hypothetical protein Ct61P_06401 [Colletotrichum tofieldiae]